MWLTCIPSVNALNLSEMALGLGFVRCGVLEGPNTIKLVVVIVNQTHCGIFDESLSMHEGAAVG